MESNRSTDASRSHPRLVDQEAEGSVTQHLGTSSQKGQSKTWSHFLGPGMEGAGQSGETSSFQLILCTGILFHYVNMLLLCLKLFYQIPEYINNIEINPG